MHRTKRIWLSCRRQRGGIVYITSSLLQVPADSNSLRYMSIKNLYGLNSRSLTWSLFLGRKFHGTSSRLASCENGLKKCNSERPILNGPWPIFMGCNSYSPHFHFGIFVIQMQWKFMSKQCYFWITFREMIVLEISSPCRTTVHLYALCYLMEIKQAKEVIVIVKLIHIFVLSSQQPKSHNKLTI